MHSVPWRFGGEALFATSETTNEICRRAGNPLRKDDHDDWLHDVPLPKVSFLSEYALRRGGHSSRGRCYRVASCRRLPFEKGE
jgi:hypothetical protein